MRVDTQGWVKEDELRNLCLDCLDVYKLKNLCSCEYGQPVFPTAKQCPTYKSTEAERE